MSHRDVDFGAFSTSALRTVRSALRDGVGALDPRIVNSWGIAPEVATPLAATLDRIPAPARTWVLDAVLAERTRSDATPRPRFVWTGPDAKQRWARATSETLKELFASAERHVLLAGYAFSHGDEIFAPLHARMDAGVAADFYVNLEQPNAWGAQPVSKESADAQVAEFLATNWPFGDPTPRIHVDKRALEGGVYASLHAKLVVVDEARVMVGSANFTQRGQERNIEAGVYLEDPAFARAVVAQFRAAVSAGAFVEWGES